MSNLAIIPARGGSKRIPRKNIKAFLGKPIISYSIDTACRCGLFDEVMVSTDDPEISETALNFGAKVPWLRSVENADDLATITDVMMEVVSQYEKSGKSFDKICCILPTSPLIQGNRIVEAYDRLINDQLDSVVAVVEFSYPICRALEITEEGKLQMIWPQHLRTRSQDLSLSYHDSGSFVWVDKDALLREKTLLCKNGGAIVLSSLEAQDIDTESDWTLAELKYRIIHG
jgi:N-acylneuraminate cytidylyltransferase